MRPDEESEDGDGNRRQRDKAVSENSLAREASDDFGNNTHRRQNHDVDGWMRVEPKQMLEQERIAAEFGIENAKVQSTFCDHEHECDGDDRSSKDLNDAGGVVRPDEE